MSASISFAELLDYTDDETRRWKEFFQKNPKAFEVPTDIRGANNVRELVAHVFVAELIFGAAALGEPRPDFEKLAQSTLDEVFAIGDGARKKMRDFVERSGEKELAEQVPFGPAGQVSKRKLLAQALTHGMRHWAQLATDLRRAGHPTDWMHDILMSPAVR
jgi:uncharacterized damage-inducible protein DinB